MKCGGFVFGDPKGSRVVTASALELIQKAGAFDGNTKIAKLRESRNRPAGVRRARWNPDATLPPHENTP